MMDNRMQNAVTGFHGYQHPVAPAAGAIGGGAIAQRPQIAPVNVTGRPGLVGQPPQPIGMRPVAAPQPAAQIPVGTLYNPVV